MAWRLANSLVQLRKQVNEAYPARSKDSDGSIGDEGHSARTSDHNPDDAGVVRAIDITHDPAHGFDSYKFANLLLGRQDPRIKYIISNRRIGSGPAGPAPGVWRKYTGANPHDHHVHISVVPGAAGDSALPWKINGLTNGVSATPYVAPPATVRPGASNDDVARLQKLLGAAVTGVYALRSETEFALKLFQVRNGLDPDGVCGPMTWARLAPETKSG